MPDIRILFPYTFQVKNLIEEKEFKSTTHKIYQGANVTTTTTTTM